MRLTQKQNNILNVILRFIDEEKMPPTYRDIAEKTGISLYAARDHVLALEKKGFVEIRKGKARGIIVISYAQ